MRVRNKNKSSLSVDTEALTGRISFAGHFVPTDTSTVSSSQMQASAFAAMTLVLALVQPSVDEEMTWNRGTKIVTLGPSVFIGSQRFGETAPLRHPPVCLFHSTFPPVKVLKSCAGTYMVVAEVTGF